MNKKPKFAEIMKRYYTDETLGLEKPKTELPEEVPTNATGTQQYQEQVMIVLLFQFHRKRKKSLFKWTVE